MLFRIFNSIFFTFLLLVGTVVLLTALGWVRLLVVKTGSMAPTYPVNSLLLIVPSKSIFNYESTYRQGEVITFKQTNENVLITHRVKEVINKTNQVYYKTKGDANQSADASLSSGSNVFGKVVFGFPYFGTAANFFNSFLGLFLLVILPASFVVLHEVLVIQKEWENQKFEVRKKNIVLFFIPFLLLLIATPVYSFFGGSVFLTENSLSTKESFVADHVVINEVYYQVDSSHGTDSSKDRNKVCSSNGTNFANIDNSVSVDSNSGNNNSSNNSGGNISINTGSSSESVNINNNVNSGANCGQNDEWIELYNPTTRDISLKNWSIGDNSSKLVKINSNKILKAKGFALVSKSASTWQFWSPPSSVLKIELGKIIGDGLDNSGDHLILKNSSSQIVDQISYDLDHSVFNPSIPKVSLGNSFERASAGVDNDIASDFVERQTPTPGN